MVICNDDFCGGFFFGIDAMSMVVEFSCAVAAVDSPQTLSGMKINKKNVAQCVRAAGWIFFLWPTRYYNKRQQQQSTVKYPKIRTWSYWTLLEKDLFKFVSYSMAKDTLRILNAVRPRTND